MSDVMTTPTDLVAEAQANLAAALASHDDAEGALAQAKERCLQECGEAQANLATLREAGATQDDVDAAVWTEEEAHARHREELESAYAEFGKVGVAELNLRRALRGFGPGPVSSPAPSGETTDLEAHVVVASDLAAG